MNQQINSYTTGQRVRMRATCWDLGGNLVDPTTIAITIKLPSGTLDTSETVVRDSLGNYHCDYTTAQDGGYVYRFVGTGAAVVAGEGEFICSSSIV